MDEFENAWFEVCKEYYDPVERSQREEILLQLQHEFDSLAPVTGASSSPLSSSASLNNIAPSHLHPLMNQCGITVDRMQRNNSDGWYRYNKLRDDARSAVHGDRYTIHTLLL